VLPDIKKPDLSTVGGTHHNDTTGTRPLPGRPCRRLAACVGALGALPVVGRGRQGGQQGAVEKAV
jgi:hypothetical protein